MQGGCGAAITYIYIHIFSMQCKLYSITSPTAFWAPWKLRDGERESKWQFSQRARKVLSLSPLVSTEKTSNAASVMYSGQGEEKKNRHFHANPSLQSENFELRVNQLNAQPETGGEEQNRAMRFWSRSCNPASWLSPMEDSEQPSPMRAPRITEQACNSDRRGVRAPGLPHSEPFCGSYQLSSPAEEPQHSTQLAGTTPQPISWQTEGYEKCSTRDCLV